MKPKSKRDSRLMKELEDAAVVPVTEDRDRRKLRREAKKRRSKLLRREGKKEIKDV